MRKKRRGEHGIQERPILVDLLGVRLKDIYLPSTGLSRSGWGGPYRATERKKDVAKHKASRETRGMGKVEESRGGQ